MAFFEVGLKTVLVNKTVFLELAKLAVMLLSIASKVASLPSAKGPRKRAVSYKFNTDACTLAELAPLLIDDLSFPSILIGRPSLVLTTTAQ